jgi:chitinase
MVQPAPKSVRLLAIVVAFLLCCLGREAVGRGLSDRPLVIGYLASWTIAASGLRIADIPAERLTHIAYAFGKVSDSGLAALLDPCRDAGECQEGEASSPGGYFADLLALKQIHPRLQVLIAVGGWTGSRNFSDVAANDEARKRFVASCIDLYIRKYPGLFDGIDIDWEFPVEGGLPDNVYRPEDGKNFGLLMAEFRRQLDSLSPPPSGRYVLSIAVSAAPDLVRHLELKQLADTVNWINVITYDYHEGSKLVHFNAPLFKTANDPTPGLNVQTSIQALLNAGVPNSKLIVGVPFYGRAYGEVASKDAGLFQTGNPMDAIPYRVLMGQHLESSGFQRFWNAEAQASWLYNAASRMWITYDDPTSLARKAAYVREHGLGGIMMWDLSDDDGSLLSAIDRGLKFQGVNN